MIGALVLLGAFRLNGDTGLLGTARQGKVSGARAPDGSVVVAWEDWRNGNADIYFSVFDPSGTPLVEDRRANPDSTLGDQLSPSVAFGPGVFAIVWEDRGGPYPKIRFHLFDASGEPAFRSFAVDDRYEDDAQSNPFATWKDSTLWIVWEDERLGINGIHTRLFHTNGAAASFVLDVSEDNASAHKDPRAAAGDSTVIITWHAVRDTTQDAFYRVFNPDGEAAGSAYAISPTSGDQTLTWPLRWSQGFWIFWFDSNPDSGTIKSQLYTRFGSALGPPRTVVSGPAARRALRGIDLPGDSAALAWWETGHILWTATDTAGVALFAPRVLDDSPTEVLFFDAVPEGDSARPFWTDERRVDPDVYTWSGQRINSEEPPQITPGVAVLGNRALAAWTDYRNDTGPRNDPDVYARIFDETGALGPDFQVPAQQPGLQAYPGVAAVGDSFLVLWQDERDGFYQIYGRFVDSLGNPLGGDFKPMPSANYQTRPSVASLGAGYVAVWEELVPDWQILGVIQPPGTGFSVSDPGDVSRPRVASSGNGNFCVAWVQDNSAFCRFFSASGTPLTPPFAVSPALHQVQSVAVGATDSLFTVAWDDVTGVYAKTLRPNGDSVSGSVVQGPWTGNQWRASVACFGDSVAVLWDGFLTHPALFARQFTGSVDSPAGGFAELDSGGALPRQCYPSSFAGGPQGILGAWCDWRGSKGSDIYAGALAWDFVPVEETAPGAPAAMLLGNPARGALRIRVSSSTRRAFCLYDAAGRRLGSWSFQGPGVLELPVSHLSPGVYMVSSGSWAERVVILR